MTSREGNTRSARHSASSQHRSCYLFLGISWQAAANSLGLLEKEKKNMLSRDKQWQKLRIFIKTMREERKASSTLDDQSVRST